MSQPLLDEVKWMTLSEETKSEKERERSSLEEWDAPQAAGLPRPKP